MHTIMVVDDEKDIVDVVASVLEEHDYQVIKAFSGTEAYIILQDLKVDLIISDYMMPGLSGMDLYFRLLEDPDHYKVPFIVMSAFAEEVENTSIYAAFLKPFSIEKLIEAVRRALAADGGKGT